ncbi:hypothetical protein NLJ89_g6490 [Agrocybe chaxingu]|uniref:NAD(P)-binding protein n=1 Tax=Agrocybe chaxingu TaxID=84603 RepID=A0A9W8JZ50_9AGAR|nr:hypothetical protein NLJ89_g6490 [Agrocybe chaxingu]
MAPQLVWLITGTTSGLGRELALEALKRGDRVIATGRGRSIAKLADLKDKGAGILELDVTSPLETFQEVAKKAAAIHGRIDVLVNNAGYPETFHDKISPLGLRSICVDFGYFRTSLLESDRRVTKPSAIANYQEAVEQYEAFIHSVNGKQLGNPLKGVEAVADVVRGEGSAAGKLFPKSLALGTNCYNTAKKATEEAKRLEEWKVSFSTDF